MLKRLKVSVLAIALFGGFLVPLSASGASIKDSVCKGTNLSFSTQASTQKAGESDEAFAKRQATEGCTANGANEDSLNGLVGKIVNIISIIVGIIAVIMIIIGGFKYITSGGDAGKVTSAKNTILYAVIGIVIVALAQFIVKFVLGQSSNLVG